MSFPMPDGYDAWKLREPPRYDDDRESEPESDDDDQDDDDDDGSEDSTPLAPDEE